MWTAPQLRDPATIARIRQLQPDLGISAFFGYILKPEVFEMPRLGCINLHTAYLPWNRGWHTNVWPIVDGSPAGVTIHFIDAGVDTGDIIVQRRTTVEWTDTGASLHEKLNRDMLALFKESWPLIKSGRHPRITQNHAAATIHRRSDLTERDKIDDEKQYLAKDLINYLRARTYPPFPSAYWNREGRRTYVRAQLVPADAAETGDSSGSAEAPIAVDLERLFTGCEMFRILASDSPSRHCAYITDGSRRYLLLAQLLSEAEIDPSGTPGWIMQSSGG